MKFDRDRWREHAACSGLSPVFDLDYYDAVLEYEPPDKFQGRFKTPQDAAAVCWTCPVRIECETEHDIRLDTGEQLDCVAGGWVYETKKNANARRLVTTRKAVGQ